MAHYNSGTIDWEMVDEYISIMLRDSEKQLMVHDI